MRLWIPGPAHCIAVVDAVLIIERLKVDGWRLRGGVAATIVAGRVVYVNGDVPDLALAT